MVVTGLIQDGKIHNLLIVDKNADKAFRILGTQTAEVGKSDDPSIVMSLKMKYPHLLILDPSDKKRYDAVNGEAVTYNVLAKSIKSSYFNTIGPSEMSSLDLYKDVKEKEVQNEDKRLLNLYRMELHKKFSIPFGAFFFVLLAFAISSAGKVNNQGMGFVLGLLIAVGYWAMFMGGQTLCLRLDWDGTSAMWVPNMMVFAASIVIFGKRLFR